MARPVPSPMAPCPTGRDPSMAASSAPALLSLPSSSARLLSLLAHSNSCARRSSPCRAATAPAPGQVSLRAAVRPAPLLAELYPLPMAELPARAAISLHQRRSSLCPAASLSWSFFVFCSDLAPFPRRPVARPGRIPCAPRELAGVLPIRPWCPAPVEFLSAARSSPNPLCSFRRRSFWMRAPS
ncbi:uncharacterized protein LOC100193136 [Zea mays]|uniref:Uncharacterized protein n=1 Tax=Zea mays TaxID=4577 RepID=B4FDY2_MAIZE|nr:uncharacterized protein LOC100193136 [Zea mays]ACF80325.1 unknown [Zea mays]|eukprot:NP_001131767.1 uncharacterized protein LOC100193136 [Zea mays]